MQYKLSCFIANNVQYLDTNEDIDYSDIFIIILVMDSSIR